MNKNDGKIILGIVGHPSSGKDTVAEYLVQKHHFSHISMGDIIREHIKKERLGEPNRDLMHKTGNSLREKNSPDYLVTLGLQNSAKRIILGGIRSLAEGKKVKSSGGYILSLDAPIEWRYNLAKERGRIGDESFDDFKRLEEAEARDEDPNNMNVEGIMRLSDFTIENSGSLDELKKKIDEVMQKILKVTKK